MASEAAPPPELPAELHEIEGMDINAIVNDTVAEATKDVLGEPDLEAGEDDEELKPKGPRPLTDMSAMELLLRDTRAFVQQQKRDREMYRKFRCAAACGYGLAFLMILALTPWYVATKIYRFVAWLAPAAPKRDAPVQPQFWDPAKAIKPKAKLGAVVDKASQRDKKRKHKAPPKSGRSASEVVR